MKGKANDWNAHRHPPHRNNHLHWDLYPRLTSWLTKKETPYNPSLGVLLAFPNLGSPIYFLCSSRCRNLGVSKLLLILIRTKKVLSQKHRECNTWWYAIVKDSGKHASNEELAIYRLSLQLLHFCTIWIGKLSRLFHYFFNDSRDLPLVR